MEQGGFIKLYRSMLHWEWYDDKNVKVLFLHLLLKANYEEKRWRGNKIEKGQILTTVTTLSKETGLTVKQVRNCIKKLESTGEIVAKRANGITLINIEKWGFFQQDLSQKGSQGANEGQTKGKRNKSKIMNKPRKIKA